LSGVTPRRKLRGAESRRARLPALEAGVLINHYQEGAVPGDFGQPTTPRTLVDFFVTARKVIRIIS
jgi:hypothetical protein